MVVLTGNIFYDSTLESEIAARWTASPYGFCSLAEFNEMKSSEDYYFLLSTKGQFKNETEPGLLFLTLVKGGPKAETGISHMLEVVSIPVASAEDPSGRETLFMPAFLDIIQSFALESMDKDISGYTGLSNYSLNLVQTKGMNIVFSHDDLSSEITNDLKESCFDDKMTAISEEDADEYMSEKADNTVVSYIAVPTNADLGSYCYKMLIDNHSHKLYYFKKHRINKKTGAGFLAEDIRRISSYRRK